MKLRTQHGKWYITDGDQVVTRNSSAEAWKYIRDKYINRKDTNK